MSNVKTAAPIVDVNMSNGDETAGGGAKRRKLALTKPQQEYFARAIKEASSLQEVEKLQRDMAEGRLPAHLMEVE